MSSSTNGRVIFQEFSIPLIAGVVVALIAANLAPVTYEHIIHWLPLGKVSLLGHELSLHFLVNDIFMAFFFGIAAKEITEAALPGWSLNSLRNAINPLIATAGGVLGPVAVFFAVLFGLYHAGAFDERFTAAQLYRGWGIPTATDIVLAWLVARAVFGRGHPAIHFLLLLAIVDDAIGLIIIAVFFGNPEHPARPEWLALVVAGMALAYTLRRAGVKSWAAYIFIAGPLSWCGLIMANLHPALALVPIVPFLPVPGREPGLFEEAAAVGTHHSPLHQFEHSLGLTVDFGLFFFAFVNAGVQFPGIGPMTWVILIALVVGKTAGIGSFGWLAVKLGFPLPPGMTWRDLFMLGLVATLGLTVALLVAGAAFDDPDLQGQAKMGALLSGLVGVAVVLIGRMLDFRGARTEPGSSAAPPERAEPGS